MRSFEADLSDIKGQSVWKTSGQSTAAKFSIDNRHLAAGVYILKLKINGEASTYKLVKK